MNVFERVKTVLFLPKNAWEEIQNEDINTSSLIISYLLPLMLIPLIATFISYGIIGYKIPFLGYVSSYEMGLRQVVSVFFTTFIGVFIAAFIIDILAPTFGAEKNFNNSLKLVIYSYTPSLVGGIFLFYYATSILTALLGFYGLYLLYLGIKPMMNVKEDRQFVYFVISLVGTIGVFIALSFLFSLLFIGNAVIC